MHLTKVQLNQIERIEKAEKEGKYWKFIGTSTDSFMSTIKEVLKITDNNNLIHNHNKNAIFEPNCNNEQDMKRPHWEQIKFLDVGSGTGNVCILIKALNSFRTRKKRIKTDGIEHNPKLTQLANEAHCPTQTIDALKFNYYDKYDIIHYYQPIQNFTLMKKLERKIERKMKVGAIIMTHLKQDRTIDKNKKFKLIKEKNPTCYKAYQKITT